MSLHQVSTHKTQVCTRSQANNHRTQVCLPIIRGIQGLFLTVRIKIPKDRRSHVTIYVFLLLITIVEQSNFLMQSPENSEIEDNRFYSRCNS